MRSSVSIALVLLLNFSALSFAREQARPSCSNRAFTVFVQDSQGRPIKDLVPADFEARVHGKPTKIVSVTADARPRRLLVIVDATHSMKNGTNGEPPRWRWQIALARHFFEQNRDRAQIALLIFSEHINDAVGFSGGNAAVDAELQQAGKDYESLRRTPGRATTLDNAILQGLQLFDHPNSADVIYLLSDGMEHTATTESGEVIQRLIAMQVRLFAVLLQEEPGYRNKTAEEVLGQEELSEIARKSGGSILSTAEWHKDRVNLSANSGRSATTQETLTRLYQAISQDVLLEIEFPFTVKKDESFELKMSSSGRYRWKGAHITYPEVVLGCDLSSVP